MTRYPIDASANAGLYRGAPAVAFVVHTADRPEYKSALDKLDQRIASLTEHRLYEAHGRIQLGLLPRLGEYDLITGLTGIGTYLLHRNDSTPLLRDILAYLVSLSRPLRYDGHPVPGWWCRNGLQDSLSPDWPDGHGNLGLAHGIAGPLALLATAMRRGITVDGQRDAVALICEWLMSFRRPRGGWPGAVSHAELLDGRHGRRGPQRPSWCYGTPGIVRALQLAGMALGDTSLQRCAELDLIESIADDQQLSLLTDTGLCHGWAGLVQTMRHIVNDAVILEIAEHAVRLKKVLTAHLIAADEPAQDGLLEGRSGYRMVLDGLADTCSWDACLLLTG